ncbi:MAG: DUF1353 domain-containing protein [Syntrophorhabdaceae bacterium]
MPFLTPIRAEKILFKDIWTLTHDFVYHHAPTEYLQEDFTVTIPAGFYTDWASVPRLPVIYRKYGNTGHEAALVHDYLYRKDSEPQVSKETADRTFYDALVEMGLSERHAACMYDGVVIGGASSYHAKAVKDILQGE